MLRLLRRGMLERCQATRQSSGDNPLANVFKKTGKLDVLFLQEDRRAYLRMLLPHVIRCYREGLIVPSFAMP